MRSIILCFTLLTAFFPWYATAESSMPVKAIHSAISGNSHDTLRGTWQGTYSYSSSEIGQPVKFILSLSVNGSHLTGKVSEPNTFGDPSASFLRANIDGSIEGELVRFTKTYDGTGGQKHSVEYEGIYDQKASTISGSWAIGKTNGNFEMMQKK